MRVVLYDDISFISSAPFLSFFPWMWTLCLCFLFLLSKSILCINVLYCCILVFLLLVILDSHSLCIVCFTCIIIKVTIFLYFSLSIFIKKRSLSSLSSEVLVAVVVVMPLHYSFSLYYIRSFALWIASESRLFLSLSFPFFFAFLL